MKKSVHLVTFTLVSIAILTESQSQGNFLGCFKDNPIKRDLSFQPPDGHKAGSVDNCISLCRRYYFRYAGVQNGGQCFCGSRFNSLGEGVGLCTTPCEGNRTQICGGDSANSIFDTSQRVSGPPSSLKVSNVSEGGMRAVWSPPKAPNGVIDTYVVSANLIRTFSSMTLSPEHTWVYSNDTLHADISFLHPGTQYNISVRAVTTEGHGVPLSLLETTMIGEPHEPPEPEILEHDEKHGRLVIRVQNGTSDNGPITAYRIVIVIGLAAFSPELLDTYQNAQRTGLSFYIAAEVPAEKMEATFIVGDGRRYGGYYNAPLPLEEDIRVTLGVVSSMNNHTHVAYSATHSEIVIPVDEVDDVEEGLTVAIVVCSVLLLLVVFAYFAARHFAPQRRARGATRMQDPQEMCLQGPMIEVENHGYVPEEEEMNKPDHYEHLKKVLWNIPRNFLDVKHSDVLGSGAFGQVVKGSVQKNHYPMPTAVYCIEDEELSPSVKKTMLQDLAQLVRCGTGNHSNVVRLIGTCESPETLYVVVEFHPATLKDMLLESRSLERPAHERDLSTVCSLPQQALLQVAVGVAQGMDHLASNKIIHKQLAACSVLMADGMVPKITSFGIAKYNRANVVCDYTRWTAREIFRSSHYTVKSDVWSMGCLLWEVAALGGTLYCGVRTSEVGARVMRGLRPPQMSHVSDDFYQLMLQCWQLDLDERPSFSEIARTLCDLIDSSLPHLDWSVMPGFRYEQYIPELEQCQS